MQCGIILEEDSKLGQYSDVALSAWIFIIIFILIQEYDLKREILFSSDNINSFIEFVICNL